MSSRRRDTLVMSSSDQTADPVHQHLADTIEALAELLPDFPPEQLPAMKHVALHLLRAQQQLTAHSLATHASQAEGKRVIS